MHMTEILEGSIPSQTHHFHGKVRDRFKKERSQASSNGLDRNSGGAF